MADRKAPTPPPTTPRKVFLLTAGSGEDGDEWEIISIHMTKNGAKRAKRSYSRPRKRPDGSLYSYDAEVEEWEVED